MAKAPLFAVLLFLTAVPSVEAAGYRLECPSRDVDRAIRGCTIAIGTAGANLPVAYANRCVAFWLKGAYARAAEDCEQALQHGGTFAVAHFIRGIDLADKGDQPAAIAEYSRSIELTPTGSAYFNRGTAYLALGDRVRAITDFDKAIAAQPSPPQAHLNRGIALLGSGRTDEITAEFDRGVELLHGEPFASSIRAEALQVLNLEHGGYGSSHPVRSFPPSKVLPEVSRSNRSPASRYAPPLCRMRLLRWPCPHLRKPYPPSQEFETLRSRRPHPLHRETALPNACVFGIPRRRPRNCSGIRFVAVSNFVRRTLVESAERHPAQ